MAGRNRGHVLSLHDPPPPILGRAPLPHLDDPHHLRPHPSLVLEERIAAQQREIHDLLLDNQRLAATHVALKQELESTQHDLRFAASTVAKINADRDAELRDAYEASLRLEAEARLVDRMREELSRVRSDIFELSANREELAGKLQGLKGEIVNARAESQQVSVLQSDIESIQIELQKGRAAIEYEIKARASNQEQSQIMEKNMISLAREVEKLQAELADAEKRARAVAAAAAVANPGPRYTGGYGNSEIAYGGASYANVYNTQQVQSGASTGNQYGSAGSLPSGINAGNPYGPAGSLPHGSYNSQHIYMNR